MKLIFDDFPADLFNLIMLGEFYRATEKDYTRLMRIFNSCVIVKQEPKSEATPYNPTGDLISRKALNDKIEVLDNMYGSDFYWEVRKLIDSIPPLPERPQGEWLKSGKGKTTFFCSECGREIDTKPFTRPDNFPFCHCGADMRKGGKK